MPKVSLTLQAASVSALDAVAWGTGRSRSSLVRHAVERYLEDLDDLALALERLQDPREMICTQVQLTEAQVRELRRVARAEGVSLAEVVRRCVDHRLGQILPNRRDRYARAARLVGRFRAREGIRDLATEHDRSLDEAFG